MADRKISDLTALTTPATGDLIPIVDVSEAAAADKNKSITVGELLRGAPDGTAAAPGIAFESDGGNGMFLDGTDILAFSTGGTQAVTIDASQRVGIGTSSPGTVESWTPGGKYLHISDTTAAGLLMSSNFPRIVWNELDQGANAALFQANMSDGALEVRRINDDGSVKGTDVVINSSGNVGIGTTSPGSYDAGADDLVVANSGNSGVTVVSGTSAIGAIYFADGTVGNEAYRGRIEYNHSNDSLNFGSAGSSPRATIDSSGRLLVGTSSFVGTGGGARLQVISNDASDTRAVSIGDAGIDQQIHLGSLSSGTNYFSWGGFYDNGWSSDDSGGTLCIGAINLRSTTSGSEIEFRVTDTASSSPKEAVSIESNMRVLMNQDSNNLSLFNDATSASYASSVHIVRTTRSSNSAFNFVLMEANGGSDDKFRVRGDGFVFADDAYVGTGADYAEYFEWSDGNANEEDRRGISVVLDGDKIREAVAGEEPIGVISANPSVVGDSAWNAWGGKYLCDDFGTYILEPHNVVSWKDADGNNHSHEDWNIPTDVVVPDDAVISATDENGNAFTHRKINPDYNPDTEYVSREDRPEWDCVGLMGKLRIRKGQVTGARWIKMRDISDTVEEWLVR